jgi:NADP-dependent 3-hydroxy acid dehydrogenase YdfG
MLFRSGLRHEVGAAIRTTTILPGAVESELKHGSKHAASAEFVQAFYQQNEIPADSVARAIAYAIEQPANVDINEIVLRPTVQEF